MYCNIVPRPASQDDGNVIAPYIGLIVAPRSIRHEVALIPAGDLSLDAVFNVAGELGVCDVYIPHQIVPGLSHVLDVASGVRSEVLGLHVLWGVVVGYWFALKARYGLLCKYILRAAVHDHRLAGVSVLHHLAGRVLLVARARNGYGSANQIALRRLYLVRRYA